MGGRERVDLYIYITVGMINSDFQYKLMWLGILIVSDWNFFSLITAEKIDFYGSIGKSMHLHFDVSLKTIWSQGWNYAVTCKSYEHLKIPSSWLEIHFSSEVFSTSEEKQ